MLISFPLLQDPTLTELIVAYYGDRMQCQKLACYVLRHTSTKAIAVAESNSVVLAHSTFRGGKLLGGNTIKF